MEKDFIHMINSFETLNYEESGGLGILSVNRPQKLNALNIQVLRELKEMLTKLHHNPIKGLIFTGEGEKAFIAGADISEMKPMSNGEANAFSELGQQVTILFESLPFPTIAAVHGFALGGGFEMALSCDFIFATTQAVFGLPEVKLGLIPGFGGTVRLMRVVGERRSKDLIFSGRNLNSEEAQKLGIALDIFPTKKDLMEGCHKWFALTFQNSSYAISKVKYSMKTSSKEFVEDALMVEREEFGNIFQTPQMKEGTIAFLEKRKPNFN
jgi:enoyl-CoA hydratase